jgi:hypothetical protein
MNWRRSSNFKFLSECKQYSDFLNSATSFNHSMIDLNATVSPEALSLLSKMHERARAHTHTHTHTHTHPHTDQHKACLDIYQHILETSIWSCKITTVKWSFKITAFSSCFMSTRCTVCLITCTLFWKCEVCTAQQVMAQWLPLFQSIVIPSTERHRQSKKNRLPVPWRQRNYLYSPSKHQEPLSQRHCVTSQKTWIEAILICPQNKRSHFKIMQGN